MGRKNDKERPRAVRTHEIKLDKDYTQQIYDIKQRFRNALDNCIRADMYHAVGTAVTNFSEKIPTTQGELAQEILKSNYDLGFVSLPPKKAVLRQIVLHLVVIWRDAVFSSMRTTEKQISM